MSTEKVCSIELSGLPDLSVQKRSRLNMTCFGVLYRRLGEPDQETLQIFSASQLLGMRKRLTDGRDWYTNEDGKHGIHRVVTIQRALLAHLPAELVGLINQQINLKSNGIFFTTDPLNSRSNGPFFRVDAMSLDIRT